MEGILYAKNLKTIILISRINKFYRTISDDVYYKQYSFGSLLPTNTLTDIISDIEEYLWELDEKGYLNEKETKLYKKSNVLLATLRIYRRSVKEEEENKK